MHESMSNVQVSEINKPLWMFLNHYQHLLNIKKLIKDTCSKTAFTASKNLYQQIDDVSMGSSLKLLLASIIMTELEQKIAT